MKKTLERLSLIAIAALACLAGTPAQNRVWIVDKNGGPGIWRDTLGLMTHVRDGDLILLRHGDYSGLGVVDKSVTIVHDTRTGPVSLATFGVQGLSATKNVTLRGVRAVFTGIQSCKGSVALEGCDFASWWSPVVDSDAVTFSRCTIAGTLTLTRSNVQLHGCRAQGGPIAPDGVTVESGSVLVASESQLLGADGVRGGPQNGQCYNQPRRGGHGIWIQGGGRAELTNCVLAGGKSAAANPPCPAAPAGSAVSNAGTLTRTTRPSGSIRANSPVREGERLSIEIGGQPGDEAFLLYNLTHGATVVPGCGAALFPSLANIGILHAGRVGNGPLKIEVIVQPMAAAMNFSPVSAQALLLPKKGCVLTPPTTIVLLDKSY